MHLITILGIAMALAMDAFAVAIATGAALKNVSARQTFRLSWHFGLFQALMPLIGWFFGTTIEHYVKTYAHWLAFLLLFLVGGNMIREAFVLQEEHTERKDATRGFSLVLLSVATSIDALAVGLSMSFLKVSIIYPALIIGAVAGAFTVAGLYIGVRAASLSRLSPATEVLGGMVLVLIGLNVLHEHGVFDLFF